MSTPGTNQDAAKQGNRNLLWAWLIGFIILAAIVWGVARVATGLRPETRATGLDAGRTGVRSSNPPPGVLGVPGTASTGMSGVGGTSPTAH